jgi:hypothetical protein
MVNRALFDAAGLGDFQDRQTLPSQGQRPRGRGFGCALPAMPNSRTGNCCQLQKPAHAIFALSSLRMIKDISIRMELGS